MKGLTAPTGQIAFGQAGQYTCSYLTVGDDACPVGLNFFNELSLDGPHRLRAR